MSVKTRKFLLLFLITIILSCRTNKLDDSVFTMKEMHNSKTAPLIGIVYTMNKKPCSGAEVAIYKTADLTDTKTKPYVTVKTDISGRFLIPDVSKGKHKIAITKKGFEEGKIIFDFVDETQVFYIQMTSLETLLDDAEKSLEKRNMNEAEKLIERALAVDNRSIEALYLKAVYFSFTNNKEGIPGILKEIKEIDPEFSF